MTSRAIRLCVLTCALAVLGGIPVPAVAGPFDPPVASFTHRPESPAVGEALAFISTATATPPWTIRDVAWDFDGDGVFEQSGSTALHPGFTTPGRHDVTMRVTDGKGDKGTVTQPVLVGPAIAEPSPQPLAAPGPVIAPVLQPPAPFAQPASQALSPFPVVRLAGTVARRGVRVRLFTVYAPLSATVAIHCRGRGCPFARRGPSFVTRANATGPNADAGRTLTIERFGGRLLRAGTTLRIFVMHPTRIGKYTRFVIRSGRPPSRVDRCLKRQGRVVFRCQ